MTPAPDTSTTAKSPNELQAQVRARIDTLSYLPTTAGVAMRFVELGRNPEAEPADYAKVIGADSSLSSKLLALANSSWAGVRTKVTTIKMAVNLLGVGTVRTLAISYCMTGLHNELRLSPSESEAFWESALSKAVAAKQYASLSDAKRADEAFVAGLFQDFALPVMYAVARQPYLDLLRNPATSAAAQLSAERALFGMDHTEIGRALAQKLELPELFVDTVAFHHSYERLTELVQSAVIRDATFAAALFPHTLQNWHEEDARVLAEFLREHASRDDVAAFVSTVQQEFGQLYSFFNEGNAPRAQLTDLLAQTARAIADQTTALVGTVNELLQEAATLGVEFRKRVRTLEGEANCDQLTGAVNRNGFTAAAQQLLANAARYGYGFAVGYLDIDHFKMVNDSFGHGAGDQALQNVVSQARSVLPPDTLIARIGGDEFVFLLDARARQDAVDAAERVVRAIAAQPVSAHGTTVPIRVSAGLVYVKASNVLQALEPLLAAADKLMYAAKSAGGNRVEVRVV